MDIAKVALGGVAAYLIYNYFFVDGGIEQTAAGAGASTSATPPSVNIRSLLVNWANANGQTLYTFDEWRFGYNTIRGTYGPMWEEVHATHPREFEMSVDEYIALASTAGGLSGLAGISGLGNAPVVMGVDRATPLERADIQFLR